MCGIIAMLAKHKNGFNQNECTIFQQMLYADAVRGWDATGIMGVTKVGNVDIKKQAAAAGHFVMTKEYDSFAKKMFSEYQMVVGHNRKATHGEKDNNSAHPFWDDEEKICLVHNGMISNHKEFCDTSTVDSAAIANALATQSVDDVIGNITGAFAFIWYNVEEKKTYVIRNHARPMYMLETSTAHILASEDSLAYWIAKRNTNTITSCIDLKPMTLYSFSLDGRDWVIEREIELKKKVTPVAMQLVPTGVMYLPSGRPGSTMRSGTAVSSPIFDKTPDTYYLTKADIPTIEDISMHLVRDDRILCQVDSYEQFGTGQMFKVFLNMLNCTIPGVEIIMYLSAAKFGVADFTQALAVSVKNIVYGVDRKTCTIFVSDEDAHDMVSTINDMHIADVMWYDQRFPAECTICGTQVKWKEIGSCEVLIDKKTDVLLVCKSCTGVSCHA